jgi:hypothetical protein
MARNRKPLCGHEQEQLFQSWVPEDGGEELAAAVRGFADALNAAAPVVDAVVAELSAQDVAKLLRTAPLDVRGKALRGWGCRSRRTPFRRRCAGTCRGGCGSCICMTCCMSAGG